MAIDSKKTEIIEGGEKKPALVVTFTNGALLQLEDLKKLIGSDDPVEVIKVGIAFIQRLKEDAKSHAERAKATGGEA